jgi:uncharacterized membrane protein
MENSKTAPVAPTPQPAKKPMGAVLLTAIIAIIMDFGFGFMAGDDKSSMAGITSDIAHIVTLIAIVSMLFMGTGWSSLSKTQKPLVTIVIACYSISAILDLLIHAAGMEFFETFSMVSVSIGFLALIVAVIIGLANKNKRKK